jgi:hypothetical protein
MQTNEEQENPVPVPQSEQAAEFNVHPGVRAFVIPFWMIEKISVDFTTGSKELVVQLKKEEEIEGEKDEDN